MKRGNLVDNLAGLLVEVVDEVLEVFLLLHSGFRMRDTVDVVVLNHQNARQQCIHIVLAGITVVQRGGHTLSKKFAADVAEQGPAITKGRSLSLGKFNGANSKLIVILLFVISILQI